MAIYHLNIKTGSKGNGKSAGAKAEYIEREGKYKPKEKDVLMSESGNMPYWAEKKPSAYWKSADIYERSNGRLYKELEFSLPKELKDEDKISLVRDYVSYLTGGENLPYTWAIHNNDPNNPHCHLIISERVNDNEKRPRDRWFSRYNGKSPQKGGARKTEALKSREWFNDTTEKWETFANHYLEEAGFPDIKIDRRSLEAQGINRPKPVHFGMAAWQMEKDRVNKKGEVTRGAILTERGDMKREAEELFQARLEYMELGEYIKNEERKGEAIQEGITDFMSKFEEYQNNKLQEKIDRGIGSVMSKFDKWQAEKEAQKEMELKKQREQGMREKRSERRDGGFSR
jgi:hypothetical protein